MTYFDISVVYVHPYKLYVDRDKMSLLVEVRSGYNFSF